MNLQNSMLWNVQRILKAFLPLIVLLSGMTTTHTAHAESPDDILVVANLGVNKNGLGVNEARDIFLKQKTSWGGGASIIPINSTDPKLREEFRTRVIRMTAAEEKKYWQSRKIKDGVQEVPSFTNILKVIFKLRGAVSYMYRSQFVKGIAKVLLVIPAN